MTPKLLHVYVRCFRDDYISVRELACKSSQFLNEKHEKVIESLVFMARFDRVNKLKALAIRSNFCFKLIIIIIKAYITFTYSYLI
jgi:hypothetical protein